MFNSTKLMLEFEKPQELLFKLQLETLILHSSLNVIEIMDSHLREILTTRKMFWFKPLLDLDTFTLKE